MSAASQSVQRGMTLAYAGGAHKSATREMMVRMVRTSPERGSVLWRHRGCPQKVSTHPRFAVARLGSPRRNPPRPVQILSLVEAGLREVELGQTSRHSVRFITESERDAAPSRPLRQSSVRGPVPAVASRPQLGQLVGIWLDQLDLHQMPAPDLRHHGLVTALQHLFGHAKASESER